MPRVILQFERLWHQTMPIRYRLVDWADAPETFQGKTNATIERFDGYDAMHGERWSPAGQEGIDALLNEVIYFNIKYAEPQGGRGSGDPGVADVLQGAPDASVA